MNPVDFYLDYCLNNKYEGDLLNEEKNYCFDYYYIKV